MKQILLLSLLMSICQLATAQISATVEISLVKGLSIAAPKPDHIDRFIAFINDELGPKGINTLLLRVDYNYQYQSHPELQNEKALSKEQVKQIVKACKAYKINIVPQINLLGHQSWASSLENLLKVYPQFDETPHVEIPEKYEWPNEDGLYCKSYCPLHPEVHAIVFELVDELMDAFEATSFHAGMDEVFYIADDRCPRCSGLDPATLFANEVRKINDHLIKQGRELWIWGDRLIDGKTTGMGMWEASMNNTHRAIDMIPKTVVICDWHYERSEPTAAYFALKGFRVITCPWDKPVVANEQFDQMVTFKNGVNPTLSDRYLGMMQTIWTSAENFLDQYEGKVELSERQQGQVKTFKTVLKRMGE